METETDVSELEGFAMDLHEAGREAVEKGNTVGMEKNLHKPFAWIEWIDLGPKAKEGRRSQAKYLMSLGYLLQPE